MLLFQVIFCKRQVLLKNLEPCISSFFLSFGVQTRVEDAENKVGDIENRAEKVESTGIDLVKGNQC